MVVLLVVVLLAFVLLMAVLLMVMPLLLVLVVLLLVLLLHPTTNADDKGVADRVRAKREEEWRCVKISPMGGKSTSGKYFGEVELDQSKVSSFFHFISMF